MSQGPGWVAVSSSEAVIHVLTNLATNEPSISLGESTMRSAGDPFPGRVAVGRSAMPAEGPLLRNPGIAWVLSPVLDGFNGSP
jgi:hypothetical protein